MRLDLRSFNNNQFDFNRKNILITEEQVIWTKFVKKLSNYKANRLIIFSRDEQKQFEMSEKF